MRSASVQPTPRSCVASLSANVLSTMACGPGGTSSEMACPSAYVRERIGEPAPATSMPSAQCPLGP